MDEVQVTVVVQPDSMQSSEFFFLDHVQVWKDVDGIMTADPRLVPSAKPVDHVTYEEAAELAFFGAQVEQFD